MERKLLIAGFPAAHSTDGRALIQPRPSRAEAKRSDDQGGPRRAGLVDLPLEKILLPENIRVADQIQDFLTSYPYTKLASRLR